MTRRVPVDPATRRRVEHELRHPQDPPRSRAAVAAEAGVSARTVSRWADDLGLPPGEPWKTDAVRAATISATDRRRAERSDIADELQRRAREILAKLDGPFLVFAFGGKENEYNEHVLDGPPTGDIRNLVTSANTLLGRAQDIDKADAQPDDQGADDVLAQLFDGLGAAYRVLRGEQPPDPLTPDDGTDAEVHGA